MPAQAATTRHLLSLLDLATEELEALLERARVLKKLRGSSEHPRSLTGKTVAILMEKSSTRTRVSFVVGVSELGGNPMDITPSDLQLGRGEPLEDTARVFSRYVHGIVYRTKAQQRLEALAQVSAVPVINGLTDKYHPCQVLADLMTVCEHRAQGLRGLRVAWVGDGNNMAHSWIVAAGLMGFELRLACPAGYEPDAGVIAAWRRLGRGQVDLASVSEAVQDADVVTTDVWASMGQEDEVERRRRAFAGYRVSTQLMATAASDAIFLHCLPAHRGEEVDAAVIDGPSSRVWDEAENRLHVQKAVLELLLGSSEGS